MAINRDAIVDRVMEGNAEKAGQIATPGMFGYNPNMKAETFDAEGAKKLLAEAGYPNGFKMTIHGPNDRYINDAKILEAIASMLARIGIKTEVVTMPKATYFSRIRSGGAHKLPEFSFFLSGFGTATGETMSQLWMLLHTFDEEKALGHSNNGRYANDRIDAILDEAITTLDDVKREKMLWEISDAYMKDIALIPLHWQVNLWASKAGLEYQPRLMEVTHAMHVKGKP
jgi:peptide/nickel transport system substrate-binding protein